MREAGMSVRAIGSALGISHETIAKDQDRPTAARRDQLGHTQKIHEVTDFASYQHKGAQDLGEVYSSARCSLREDLAPGGRRPYRSGHPSKR